MKMRAVVINTVQFQVRLVLHLPSIVYKRNNLGDITLKRVLFLCIKKHN